MKVTAEKIDNHQVVLEIEVPEVEVKKAINKAFTKLANKVNIPGFRKGKAPRKILEQRLGKEAILEEAFDIIAPNAFNDALDEQKIEPVTRPAIDVVTLEEGKDLVFKATVTAKPEVVLGEYKGLKVEKTAVEVTEEQIDEQLKRLMDSHANMVDVAADAVVADGDFTTIDFKGFVDEVAFEGGEGKDYPLQIGSHSFIPGFEEQLVGAKIGEERDVNVTFPEEYHADNLAGKPAVFKCTVHSIKRKEMPELNDEFAKKASSFETLDALKADIKENLLKNAQTKAENDRKTAAIKQAAENVTVEIPEVMVENRVGHMIEELSISLENRGMKLEQYLQYANTDIAAMRANYRETAAENVKTDLMLEAVAKAEEIKVEPADLQAEVEGMAKAYGTTASQVQKIIMEQGRIGDLAATIMRKKALQVVVDNIAE
jgi:trigger factor